MNRFRRILLACLTALSLILCLSSAALWILSYWRVDSVMLFRPKREYTQLWIDHQTTITFKAGPVYEADSRRGVLRLVYVYTDGTYTRAMWPARVRSPLSTEDENFGPGGVDLPAWSNSTHLGFGIEHREVAEIIYNIPPGPQPPPPTAYVIHALYTPWWFWTTLLALLPATRWRSALRARKRRRRGLCPDCGYDLRASTERCPECGKEMIR